MRSIAFSLNLTPCCYNDYSGLLQDYQLKAAHTTHATHHYQIHISYLAKKLNGFKPRLCKPANKKCNDSFNEAMSIFHFFADLFFSSPNYKGVLNSTL